MPRSERRRCEVVVFGGVPSRIRKVERSNMVVEVKGHGNVTKR